MSESTDKATLLKQTIDWLVATRLLATIEERKVILSSARFEDQLLGQIELEGSAYVFSSRLLSLLLDYDPLATGKLWLTSFLKTVGASLGVDHQVIMEGLIANVNAYAPSPDQTAVGDNRQHITSTERPSLWIGVPDLPRYGLVGRDELVTDLVNRLSTGTAVSISTEGKGGAGKTALAVALAHRRDLLAHFRDGVLWAGIGPDGDPLSALARWGMAVGLESAAYADPFELKQGIKDKIGHKAILLIIDDIWQEEHAGLLHCGGPNCAHLLTTRDRSIARNFAGSAEESFNVPELAEDPTFALLKRIAPEACAADPAAARQLALTVGGLPLAVELAGGYLNDGGPVDANIFPDLNTERLAEIGGNPALRLRQAQARIGAAPGRKATLQAAFNLSLDALPDDQTRAAFYALGAFAAKPATFERAAAESVAQTNGQTLALLVNRNLLEISAGQFALHQVLADVARASMDDSDQARHRAYYLDLADKDRQDWRTIDAAYSQIRWAWDHLPDEDVLPWVEALRRHQKTRGLWLDYLTWHEHALPIARAAGQRQDEGNLLNNLGWVRNALGQREEALSTLQRALSIMEVEGDCVGLALTLTNIGTVHNALGQREEALDFFLRALPITEEESDPARLAMILNGIGVVYDSLGRREEALAILQRAMSISEKVDDRAILATTLNNLGKIYSNLGQREEALAFLQRARLIMEDVGDRAGLATSLNTIGLVYDQLGRRDNALDFYEQALLIMEEVGDRASLATTLNNTGLLYDALGWQGEALDSYERALSIMEEMGDRAGLARTLNNIGLVYDNLGQREEALGCYERVQSIWEELGDRAGLAKTLNNIGRVYDNLGQRDEALNHYERALSIMEEMGDRAGLARTLNNIGLVYDNLGQQEEALGYYERTLPVMQEVGDRAGLATTLNNIALVYESLGRRDDALDYYERSLPIMEEMGDYVGLVMTLNSIGMVHYNLGRMDEALTAFQRVLPIREAVGDLPGESITRYTIAKIYRQAGNLRQAISQLRLVVELDRQIGDTNLEANLVTLRQYEAELAAQES